METNSRVWTALALFACLCTRTLSLPVSANPARNVSRMLHRHNHNYKHAKHTAQQTNKKPKRTTRAAKHLHKHGRAKKKVKPAQKKAKARALHLECIFVCQNSESRTGTICPNILYRIGVASEVAADIDKGDPNRLNLRNVVESCRSESKVRWRG